MSSIKRTGSRYLLAAALACLLPLANGNQDKQPEVGASITVDSEDYDPTVLNKFLPGSAFIPLNSEGVNHDALTYDSGGCVYPSSSSGGTTTIAYAPIELPDKAKVTYIIFHVVDSSTDHNISFDLRRAEINDNAELTTALLESADTAGSPGASVLLMNVEPDDVTGHVGLFGARYYSLRVDLVNAAGSANKVCGAKIFYQVPSTGANQTFTPVTPCKIFDSRPVQGGTGAFAANETRTILVTGDTEPQGGADGGCGLPYAATAVQVNFVVIDPVATGSIKLWAPVDDEPQGLLAFQSGIMSFWNGSGTIPISSQDSQKRMRVKINGGGAHVLVAVTGYYSPVSNMGN